MHREKAELLHHAQIIAICEVFDDLPAAYLNEVNALNLEVTAGERDPHEHAAVHWQAADTAVGLPPNLPRTDTYSPSATDSRELK